MLVAIINHALTRHALELKRAFSPHARTIAIDSGSLLTTDEYPQFDVALPNVYYSGLLNAVAEQSAGLDAADPVYICCSDVTVGDPARAIALVREAFSDRRIGSYAPSAHHSDHRQMACERTGRLRVVTFVDGFCFATRAGLLRQLCPIDLQQNLRGWGLEVQLGYLTRRAGQRTVVDDRIEVQHPRSTGYCRREAWRERGAWQARLSSRPRLFHRLARRKVNKHPLTMRLLLALPW